MNDFDWLRDRSVELVSAVEANDYRRALQLVNHTKAEGGQDALQFLADDLESSIRTMLGASSS